MKILNNRSGFTLMETLLVVGIISMMLLGITGTLTNALRIFQSTSVQASTDIDADIAMQNIIACIQEAKIYAISSNHATGDTLTLTFPKVNADGTYNRTILDPNNTAVFYLSDSSGSTNKTGTYLWKTRSGQTARIIRRDITSLSFVVDTTRSVKATVWASNTARITTQTTKLSMLVTLMRNY